MHVSERTIKALGKIATGDEATDGPLAPYQSGPQLVTFFNELGSNDVYGQGFPSRWQYAEAKIRSFNGSSDLTRVVEAIFDPRRFLDSKFTAELAVEYANQYLKYDGFEIVYVGEFFRVRDLQSGSISLEVPFDDPDKLSHVFIEEQLSKCDRKIADSDFDGAITNARSLLEGVLLALEEHVTGIRQDYDGDLPKLFKRVRNLLNLDPSRQDISDALRQLLSGLVSIVNGVSSLRNMMSDSHASSYRPAKHHAKLAVNAAKTVTDFLFETFQYQEGKGLLKKAEGAST